MFRGRFRLALYVSYGDIVLTQRLMCCISEEGADLSVLQYDEGLAKLGTLSRFDRNSESPHLERVLMVGNINFSS